LPSVGVRAARALDCRLARVGGVGGIGQGLVGDIVVGIIGAFIGDWLFHQLAIGAPAGMLGSIVVAFVGAVALLMVMRARGRQLRE
jgi:uncharacterized membrane protein YeaQ/YmgE (transglycosylase-associated protein family)